ncbi:PRC-barrel domain protein [Palleronia aestuarii]|uniref:PRC-barrel domain protein n=1 Tax=Palleronia aestuarii TaxID=568105 RepID=A0A2W7NFS9_9RHOB|nr:PRC-barrel domain-containing protein [Palleronia aestuarii]PZX18353.1 PRC-barrel domain protein [Palleronia aestuarii]
MKRLMTTSAAIIALGTASMVSAQDASGPFEAYEMDPMTEFFASDLIGSRIYATESDVGESVASGAETEWDDLGEINDMVISPDGSVEVVILGVGGFLGIGERDVAVSMDELQIVRNQDDMSDYYLVINANPDAVENAPEFTRADEQMEAGGTMDNGSATGTGDAAMQDASQSMDQAGDNMENAADQAGQSMENAADATAQQAEETANEAENMAEDAADQAEQATDEATENTGN